MKRALILLVIAMALMSCKNDTYSYLNVTPSTDIEFSALANETFVLTVEASNDDWLAVSSQSWCKVSQFNNKITITALPNSNENSPVPAEVKISSPGCTDVVIHVAQFGANVSGRKADPKLEVTPTDPIEFSAEASEAFILDVTTNQGSFDAISDKIWCHVVPGGTKIYITATPNTKNFARETATVTISSGQATPIKITVNQQPDNYVNMPDEIFRAEMLALYDADFDGKLSLQEAAEISEVNMEYKMELRDLTGIEAFQNLTSLNVFYTQIRVLDLSSNTRLEKVIAGGYQKYLTRLNVNGLKSLDSLDIQDANLGKIDLSTNPNLSYLRLYDCSLIDINTQNNPLLEDLAIQNNNLLVKPLDVSQNTQLKSLQIGQTGVPTVNLKGLTALTLLEAGGAQLTSIDISENINLEEVNVSGNSLTSLDVTKNTKLTKLMCHFNEIGPELDVSNNRNLTQLFCNYNPNLTTLYLATGQTISGFLDKGANTNIAYK